MRDHRLWPWLAIAAWVAAATVCGVPAAGSAAEKPAEPLWGKTCEKAKDGKEACYVFQTATQQPNNIRLLHVLFGYLGEGGKPRLILTTPLGVLLPAGVTIKIDDRTPVTAPFDTCDGAGCRVALDMDEGALDAFRTGKTAVVRYLTINRQPIEIPVKLEGLADALKKLHK